MGEAAKALDDFLMSLSIIEIISIINDIFRDLIFGFFPEMDFKHIARRLAWPEAGDFGKAVVLTMTAIPVKLLNL